MSDICVGTVIYDQDPAFAEAWVSALNEQIFRDFDQVICNDGFADFHRLESSLKTVVIHDAPRGDNWFGHRLSLIRTARDKGYKTLVFYDFDDVMPPDYLSSVAEMENFDFLVSDLSAIDSDGRVIENSIWKDRLPADGPIYPEIILSSNPLGFGNTVINLETPWQTYFVAEESDVPIPDWFFYSVNLLKFGFSGRRIPSSPMAYRSHDRNSIGMNAKSEEERLKMKRSHYEMLLLEFGSEPEFRAAIEEIYRAVSVRPVPRPSDFWWE